MRSVDAHLHLWGLGSGGYDWIGAADPALHATFTAEQASAELAAAGVDAAILVQADDTERDTASLLRVADAASWVAGVVGWVPVDDASRAESLLDRWGGHRAFCGVRQLLHDDPRDGLLLAPDGRRLATMLVERGLVLDVPNAFPRLLGDATALARAMPGLSVVIDHLAKPPREASSLARWSEELALAAALPNVVAKVSGLTVAGEPFTTASARPAWEAALEWFGPDRLMLGGDWPMTVTSGGYGLVWRTLSELVDELSPAEQQLVRGGTAMRVYGVGEGPGAGPPPDADA